MEKCGEFLFGNCCYESKGQDVGIRDAHPFAKNNGVKGWGTRRKIPFTLTIRAEMRSEVIELGKLGPLPSHESVLANLNGEALLNKYGNLIKAIKPPVTDAEAKVLVGILGPGDCFEVEWTLIHLIETAPNWPLSDCLVNSDNQWIALLKQRLKNAGRLKD